MIAFGRDFEMFACSKITQITSLSVQKLPDDANVFVLQPGKRTYQHFLD